MTVLRLTSFRGVVRALHPRLLPEANGTVVQNLKTLSGDLRPWNVPLDVYTAPGGTVSIYRMGRDAPSDTDYWLTWPSRVSVIRGLNATDATERTVYTGNGVPKWTDNTMALASPPYPTAWRILGVPAPGSAPTIAIHTDGSSTSTAEVNVVITFVTDRGEEGSVSAPSNTLTIHTGGTTIDVSSFAVVPAGNYGITKYRIYVTDVGATSATYAFAAEVATGTVTATINMDTLGSALETLDYDMPPTDGHSLTALWQFAAMATGKSVRFCALGLIYAWPSQYEMLIGDTVVGMGSFDQALLVLTTGRPALIQGQDPSSMQLQQVPLDQSCVSRSSIVSFGHGVAWASPDGLMYMSSGGAVNLTANVMNKSDWQALVPSTIVGEQQEGLYYGTYSTGGTRQGFIIDPLRPDGIIFLPTAPYPALHRDDIQDALFAMNGQTTKIQKWDGGATPFTATFTSKVFRMPAPASFCYVRLVADSYGQTVRVYADGVLRFTKTVANGSAFRIPRGFSANDWQFSIDTTTPVQALIVADNAEEVDG